MAETTGQCKAGMDINHKVSGRSKRDRQGKLREHRRRLRRVIQDLMCLVAKLTRSDRRWRLHLSLPCA